MLSLDTDILVDILRKHPSAIEWLDSLDDEELVISGFVAMEEIQGCVNRREQLIVEQEISKFVIVWPTLDDCEIAFQIFSKFYLSSGLGIIDALIGQTAVSQNVPLCTFNTKHYRAIPSIRILQPYKR